MGWTTDDFIAQVRVRAQVPDEGGEPTDAQILAIADQEMVARFEAIIRSTRENYLLTSTDVALVAGTQAYRLPRDAHTSSLADVWLIDSNGNGRPINQVDLTDVRSAEGHTGYPAGYVLRGAKVCLWPTPSSAMSGYSLRMFYYRAPSKLVLPSACQQFYGVTDDGKIRVPLDLTTVDGLPAVYSAVPDSWDLVQKTAPFDLLVDGAAIEAEAEDWAINIASSVGGAIAFSFSVGAEAFLPLPGDVVDGHTILECSQVGANSFLAQCDGTPGSGAQTLERLTVFTSASGDTSDAVADVTLVEAVDPIDGELSLDSDFICRHMETCVPQIPDALWPALVAAVAAHLRYNEADYPGAAAQESSRDAYIDAALKTMQPRVDRRAKPIVNRGSVLFRGR